jgi:ubiquinone/menaquinone biosynthesis C-methylase UbiE
MPIVIDEEPVTAGPGPNVRTPDEARPAGGPAVLPIPLTDPAPLWELGVLGVPLTQYVRWADDAGLLTALADCDALTADEIAARTPLTPRGASGLLGILCAFGLVRWAGGAYALEPVAREYLDRRAPLYIGPSLYGMLKAPFPPQLRKGDPIRRYSRFTGTLRDWFRYIRKANQFGRREQLFSQHLRNLPIAAVAVETGLFDGARRLADIGGGSGAFAIPLARRLPDLRITLVELPRALPHIGQFLAPHGVQDRVALHGFNVHQTPWPLDGHDAVLFGNFMHFCDDEECLALLRESCRMLPPGGKVFVHEMLWNDRKDGPLVTALWNFWMGTISGGGQRTEREFGDLFERAGFRKTAVVATTGGFSLVAGVKAPAAAPSGTAGHARRS